MLYFSMLCKICHGEFVPNKYHPGQQVCLNPQCQKARQIQNLSEWRRKNPDYFKCIGQEPAWQEKRRMYNKLWKNTNKDYVKTYEETHREQRREYMREYMRRLREGLKSYKIQ